MSFRGNKLRNYNNNEPFWQNHLQGFKSVASLFTSMPSSAGCHFWPYYFFILHTIFDLICSKISYKVYLLFKYIFPIRLLKTLQNLQAKFIYVYLYMIRKVPIYLLIFFMIAMSQNHMCISVITCAFLLRLRFPESKNVYFLHIYLCIWLGILCS